ncbi:MAG: hypothetical protein K2F67_07565 [Eubacterium sp.]|nr:hypothetical protein [Eubacterium sp.]
MSILQSIKPQYCELIASGKKTIEVRKTRPKLDVPFKVYIYCTKDRLLTKSHNNGKIYLSENKYKSALEKAGNLTLSGKVIGEYICDRIYQYTTCDFKDGTDIDDKTMTKLSCLSKGEISDYEISPGQFGVFGWHISNLKIYDKPKELSKFIKPCITPKNCLDCPYSEENVSIEEYQKAIINNNVKQLMCMFKIYKAPQSWCYVEEVS